MILNSEMRRFTVTGSFQLQPVKDGKLKILPDKSRGGKSDMVPVLDLRSSQLAQTSHHFGQNCFNAL